MNLRVVGDWERTPDVDPSKLIGESADPVDNLMGEVRQLSHVLHPPTLDEMGLPSAVQWYAEQFAKRTGIQVA
jgi:two-component system NarL family sensor kinase